MSGFNSTNPVTVGFATEKPQWDRLWDNTIFLRALFFPGLIVKTGRATSPDANEWLICDGAAVSRTTYADLFAAIGTTYGAGNGSTTFNLPDLRGRFPLGKAASGTGSTLGATGGALDHTHTYTDVPAHSHGITDPGHNHAQNAHNHGITDPGHNHAQNAHNHGVTDPGHDHDGFNSGSDVSTKAPGGGSDWGFGNGLGSSPEPDVVRPKTTGVSVDNATASNVSASTGVSVDNATASNQSAITGLSVNSSGVASGTTAGQNPAFTVVNYLIKT